MRVEYVSIALVALFWGSYPLVTRSAATSGHLGTLVLSLSSLIPIVAAVLWQGTMPRLAPLELTKMVVAGLMMGVGLLAFIFVANSKQLDASVSIPIMDTGMLIVTVAGAVLFFGEPITVRKLVGIVLLIAGILTLRPD
jgi:drug/metabolite transporter (DMT)-like permease